MRLRGLEGGATLYAHYFIVGYAFYHVGWRVGFLEGCIYRPAFFERYGLQMGNIEGAEPRFLGGGGSG